MMEIVTELLLALGGFAATNLENLVILVAVFCNRSENSKLVALGFFAGAMALLAISLAAHFLNSIIPVDYLGLLGLIPIALGIRELLRSARTDADVAQQRQRRSGTGRNTFLAIMILMLANGGDTLAVFAPLVAETKPSGVLVLGLGFTVAAAILALIARHACAHPGLARHLGRYGPRIAPYVMIGIGLYILINTSTDLLPG